MAGLPRHPFLLVDGTRQITLDRAVVRIGRARDGDIVLDDRRVSRRHVELRWQSSTEQFLCVDVGSTGGTKLNGYAIAQCPLEIGDILSLGGYELIYGEDLDAGSDTSESAAQNPSTQTNTGF
jgi:pSer/pThr/pTyr-binding forkhead associated (FHA) protein